MLKDFGKTFTDLYVCEVLAVFLTMCAVLCGESAARTRMHALACLVVWWWFVLAHAQGLRQDLHRPVCVRFLWCAREGWIVVVSVVRHGRAFVARVYIRTYARAWGLILVWMLVRDPLCRRCARHRLPGRVVVVLARAQGLRKDLHRPVCV